ncbi:energy transducer TonB [Ideonella paludis]|uniref:TonB family protein n=1 Tax=Ideonella paludis TaxID=1233411 RepID=A0ABS5E036_9BURK|nr:energy transducer TonB [Ideonella paludis]MBQ0936674.1 TonB family protein [Ideonella paludis]
MSPIALCPPPAQPSDLSPPQRRALTVAAVVAHAAGAWGLLQMQAVQQALAPAAPVLVQWVATPVPAPQPPPPPAAPRPKVQPQAVPVLAVAPSPQPQQAPSVVVPEPAPQAVQASTPPSPPAPPALAAPPALPASPVALAATDLRYTVPPAQVYPRTSVRLGEQGTVLVRLVVDAQGLPTQVSLHKSSGHPRLDEQALQALRAARFVPYTRNGQALAWTAIAPLEYSLE